MLPCSRWITERKSLASLFSLHLVSSLTWVRQCEINQHFICCRSTAQRWVWVFQPCISPHFKFAHALTFTFLPDIYFLVPTFKKKDKGKLPWHRVRCQVSPKFPGTRVNHADMPAMGLLFLFKTHENFLLVIHVFSFLQEKNKTKQNRAFRVKELHWHIPSDAMLICFPLKVSHWVYLSYAFNSFWFDCWYLYSSEAFSSLQWRSIIRVYCWGRTWFSKPLLSFNGNQHTNASCFFLL